MSCKIGNGLYLRVTPQGGGLAYLSSAGNPGSGGWEVNVVGSGSAWRLEAQGDDYVLADGFTSQSEAQEARDKLLAELTGRGAPNVWVTDLSGVLSRRSPGRLSTNGSAPNVYVAADQVGNVSGPYATLSEAEDALDAFAETLGALDVQAFLS